MKIAIIYGTKRKKAMVQVVEWLKAACKSEGHDVTVGKPAEFGSLEFDLFVIGSSVYGGEVVEEIVEFVKKNNDTLSGRNIATFIVCKETKTPETNMEKILCFLEEKPINQMFIEGYMFREKDFGRQENKAKEWIKEILSTL